MTVGVEIDFVVPDSREALELYEKVFEAERIEVTDLKRGQNEAVFSIYGTRFHILDENPEFGMNAPKGDAPQTMWLNVMVPDIKCTHEAALAAGCREFQAVTEIPQMGVANSVFTDPFGYMWMLHQMHREVSFEERVRVMEEMCGE